MITTRLELGRWLNRYAGETYEQWLLRKCRVNSVVVGVGGGLYGVMIGLNGAKSIPSPFVSSPWPAYVLAGILCTWWGIRPKGFRLAALGGWLMSAAWGIRALMALAWGLGVGRLFTPSCLLVASSHLMVSHVLWTVWSLRVTPVAKRVADAPPLP